MSAELQPRPDPDGPLELTTEEQAVIRTLLDPSAQVEVLLPDNCGHDDLWRALTTCCKAVRVLQRTTLRIRPLIGRIVKIARNTPDFYKQRGYQTFEQFFTVGIQGHLGLSRTDAYEALRLAEKWPTLSQEEYEQIGPSKLAIASRFTDDSMPGHRKHLEAAKQMTITEFRAYAEEKRLINPGEATPAVIVIQTTQEVASHWKEWINDPAVHGTAGSSDPGLILLAMGQSFMPECQGQSSPDPDAAPRLDPQAVFGVLEQARQFVYKHWADHQECKGSQSQDLDVAFSNLADAVESLYGPPAVDGEAANA